MAACPLRVGNFHGVVEVGLGEVASLHRGQFLSPIGEYFVLHNHCDDVLVGGLEKVSDGAVPVDLVLSLSAFSQLRRSPGLAFSRQMDVPATFLYRAALVRLGTVRFPLFAAMERNYLDSTTTRALEESAARAWLVRCTP